MISRRAIVRLVVGAGSAGLLWAAACASVPDEKRFTFVGEPDLAPSFADYKAGPDNYLGKRCGSLDCHGQLGRPLRIFSANGLRSFDASNGGYFPNLTGRTGLTDDERKLNYEAVIAVEPEVMSQVIASGGTDVNRLILIRKPRGLERHKGGQLLGNDADEGFLCMKSWLGGNGVDQASCTTAAAIP